MEHASEEAEPAAAAKEEEEEGVQPEGKALSGIHALCNKKKMKTLILLHVATVKT